MRTASTEKKGWVEDSPAYACFESWTVPWCNGPPEAPLEEGCGSPSNGGACAKGIPHFALGNRP